MRNIKRRILQILFGAFILNDYFKFVHQKKTKRFLIKIKDFYPQIKDKTINTNFDRHYIYHTSWAARVLAELRPEKHIDISSSLYFSGIISAFIPVELYDYRPADLHLSHLTSRRGDLTSLPFPNESVSSLSCMHTIEHIGLGRYGDPIDPEGDIKAVKELSRVLAPGGSLLIVVPIGDTARIEWNAHRIYTYDQVLKLFPELKLKEFSFIPENGDNGGLVRHADPELISGERYACGCFQFIKYHDHS